MSNVEDAIVRGAELKIQIDYLTSELRKINLFLSEQAEYKPGSKTGHLEACGIKVKVSTRENVKYDQDRLVTVRQHFPFFEEVFRSKWEPDSKALSAFMATDGEFRKAVEWSRTVTPGAPTVTYTKIQE